MLDAARRLGGFIDVVEQGRSIIISGAPAFLIDLDIKNHWNTRRIQIHMFKQMSRSKIVIDSFFALEFDYMIRSIIEDQKTYTNKLLLKKLLNELRENTWLSNINKDHPNPYDFKQLDKLNVKLLDHQIKYLCWAAYTKPRYRLNGTLLAASAGGGKAQPLDCKIKTPTGWTTMGEIKVGDLVSTPDGSTAEVTGTYPQGKKDIYEIVFSDGRRTRACGEHLWEVFKADHRDPSQRWEVINTVQMLEQVHLKSRKRLYVPLLTNDDSPGQNYYLSPYMIGALLGDGCTSQRSVCFTTADVELFDYMEVERYDNLKIRKLGKDYDYRFIFDVSEIKGYHDRTTFHNEIARLGMKGKLSYQKSVPAEYLNGSRSQRLSLIQGLMDTDGTVNEHSTLSFCSTSEQLALDMQYLIRSIGGIADISTKTPTFTDKDGNKVNGRLAYNVNIRYRKPSELFRLLRKKERCNDDGQYCDILKLRVESVTLLNEQEEAKCISISSKDKLYITDDFIVTHNTLVGIAISLVNKAEKTIFIAPKNSIYDAWETDIKTRLKNPGKIWIADRDGDIDLTADYFIVHYEALGKILANVNAFKKFRTVIILDESHNFVDPKSLRTQNFLAICKEIEPLDIVWSSGTPIKAMGSDVIPLFRCIDPLFNTNVEMRLKKIWGKDAAKANDVMANRLAMVSYKVDKDQFMKDEPIVEEVPVVLPNGMDYSLDNIKTKMVKFIEERMLYYKEHRKEHEAFYNLCINQFLSRTDDALVLQNYETYKMYVNTFIKSGFDTRTMGDMAVFCNKFEKEEILPILDQPLRNDFKDVKSIIKYTNLKVRGECLGRVLDKERLKAHLDMALNYNIFDLVEIAKKKTIIFTSYVEIVDKLTERFTKAKWKPLKVTAETNKNLSSIISQFDKDSKTDPLIATFQSLSTAVRLTMANNIITINSPYRDHIMTQAIARAWRIGQDEQVYVWHLVLDTGDVPNISTRTNDILKWSKEQVDTIMGFKSDMDLDNIISTESIDDYIENYVPGTTNINESNLELFALKFQEFLGLN